MRQHWVRALVCALVALAGCQAGKGGGPDSANQNGWGNGNGGGIGNNLPLTPNDPKNPDSADGKNNVGKNSSSSATRIGSGMGWLMGYDDPSVWAALAAQLRQRFTSLFHVTGNPSAPSGSPANLVVTPAGGLDFSIWPTHFLAPKLPVLLMNTGAAGANLTFTRFPQAPFYIVAGSCGGPACLFNVAFQPETPGDYADEITIEVKSENSAQTQVVHIPIHGRAYDRKLVVTAGDGGGPAVSITNIRTGEVKQFFLGDSNSRGGLGGVALGDVTGDQVPDILIGSGRGTAPRVYVIDGRTDSVVSQIAAYEDAFQGGVRVAVGDVNGDKHNDVIVGPGPGGGPRVRVFSGEGMSWAPMQDFWAYETSMTAGVNVAAADLNGDGRADIVVGPGPGGGPRLRAFDGGSGGVLVDTFIGDPNRRDGLEVAATLLNGDTSTDLVVSPGGGLVYLLDGASGTTLGTMTPFPGFGGMIRVGAMYYNSNLVRDVIVGAGPGGGPHVKVIEPLNGQELYSQFAFDSNFSGGVFVGGM